MKVYVTKVFQNGGSKAIRIPASLRPESDELFVWADELGRIIISENSPKLSPAQFLSWAGALPPLSEKDKNFLQRDQPLDDFSSPFDRTEDTEG